MAFIQGLSYAAQLSNGLRDPVKSFQQFSKTIGRTFGLNSGGSTYGKQMDAAMSRSDPVLNIDWIGMVIDKSNPNALDWHYIQSIQTPGIQIEARKVFRSGKEQHYAGTLSVDNLQLTLYTDSTGKALKFASSWFNCVFDSQTGNYRLPKDYKKDVYVYMYDPKHQTVALLKFFGCFPTSWASYSLDNNSQASPLVTTLDLVCDSFSIGSDTAAAGSQVNLLASKESVINSGSSPLSAAKGALSSVTARANSAVSSATSTVSGLASKARSFV